MSAIRVLAVEEEPELLGRSASAQVGRKTAKGLQIARRGSPSRLEKILLPTPSETIIREFYLELTLDTLRALDSDRAKLDRFLGRRLAQVGPGSLNVVVVRLRLAEGQKIVHKDVEYLWDLLNTSNIDFVVPPLLEGDYDQQVAFVQQFLEVGSNFDRERLVHMIPYEVSHRNITNFLDMYGDEAGPVYVLDFRGKHPFRREAEMWMSRVIAHARETFDEKFFTYGFDVKPHKQGRGNLVAENILLFASSMNAVGPRHTVRPLPDFVRLHLAQATPNPLGRQRIFMKSDYGYHPLVESATGEAFASWLATAPLPSGTPMSLEELSTNPKMLRTLSTVFTGLNLESEAKKSDEKVRDHSLRDHLERKRLPREIIPRIEFIKRQLS